MSPCSLTIKEFYIEFHISFSLCEHINDMYSFSLLLNFLMASMQICFIAFQVTESTVEVILIYCIFLMTSMVQVFLVCYYGDALIEAVSGANSLAVPFLLKRIHFLSS